MTIADIKKTMESKMDQSIQAFIHGLTKIRTGRANPGLLDSVQVDYYGNLTPLTQVANVSLLDARTISVATPDELDKLIDWVNKSLSTAPAPLEGEHLFAVERLVVSPASGVFAPKTSVQQGDHITIGQTLGMIGETPVVSVFEGILQSFIAVDGERVTLRQPIAWLRTI